MLPVCVIAFTACRVCGSGPVGSIFITTKTTIICVTITLIIITTTTTTTVSMKTITSTGLGDQVSREFWARNGSFSR